MSVSSTEFENKCKELVPKLEARLKEEAPNIVSVTQFFYLQDGLRLNLNIIYKTKEGVEKSAPLQVGCQQVMAEDIEPIVAVVSKALADV